MASQVLFFRTCKFLSNSHCFLNTRPLRTNLLPPTRGLKHETIDRIKMLKIPEKPKKPSSPYLLFVKEHRVEVLNENPFLKQTEVIKKCAEDWKSVSAQLKEKYNSTYKSEWKIYNEKLQTFNATLTHEQREALDTADEEKKLDKEKRKIKKEIKESNKPKRPVGPYISYLMEQSKIRNVSMKHLMVSSKSEWINLPEDEKAKYKKHFLVEKEKYEKAIAEWEARMVKEGKEHLTSVKFEQSKPSQIKQLKKDDFQ